MSPLAESLARRAKAVRRLAVVPRAVWCSVGLAWLTAITPVAASNRYLELLPETTAAETPASRYANLTNLQAYEELRRRGIRVNCTCCMSFNQAIMAAASGANFVSLFYGRIRDIGYDAASVVRAVRTTFRESKVPCEIIVGSIRHIADINEAVMAGADIVTVPPKFFRQMVAHPKTDEAVNQFINDFQKWMR